MAIAEPVTTVWQSFGTPKPEAGVAAIHGKCVGIAAAQKNSGWLYAFRAFEDGTVEATNDAGSAKNFAKWRVIGK
jgi:hypothetical protein